MNDEIKKILDKYGLIGNSSFRHPNGTAISITVEEGEYMHKTIKELGLKCGYECATGTGVSSLWLGSALKKLCSIDSYVEELYGANNVEQSRICLNPDDSRFEKIKAMNEELGTNTVLFKGISPDVVPEVMDKFLKGNEKIDFVFIDGCHYGEHPLEDIKAIEPYLKKRAVIFWHDVHVGFVKAGIEYMEGKGFMSKGCDLNTSFGLILQTRDIQSATN